MPSPELIAELAEAQESYRLANQRIIELLDEKIVLEKQRAELAAALDAILTALEELQRTYIGFEKNVTPASEAVAKALTFFATPAAILAAREKTLREALELAIEGLELNGPGGYAHEVKQILAAAPL